jgi:hypothetical protein
MTFDNLLMRTTTPHYSEMLREALKEQMAMPKVSSHSLL